MAPITELLVSYPWGRFRAARREVLQILRGFGDEQAEVERTGVDGIALARTRLDNRQVIHRCRELWRATPAFRFAMKWVPVDYWCETTLEAMRMLIETEIASRIAENETWGMKVEKRRWQQYHSADIIAALAPAIARKVNLDRPDKLVRLDLVGRRTAVSLLRPGETFSVNAPG